MTASCKLSVNKPKISQNYSIFRTVQFIKTMVEDFVVVIVSIRKKIVLAAIHYNFVMCLEIVPFPAPVLVSRKFYGFRVFKWSGCKFFLAPWGIGAEAFPLIFFKA